MSSELIRTHQAADERWPLTIAYTLQDSDEGSSELIRTHQTADEGWLLADACDALSRCRLLTETLPEPAARFYARALWLAARARPIPTRFA